MLWQIGNPNLTSTGQTFVGKCDDLFDQYWSKLVVPEPGFTLNLKPLNPASKPFKPELSPNLTPYPIP